jgi:hypothetical protein
MANIDESGLGGTYPASVVSLAATDAAEGAAEGTPNTGVMNGPIVALTGRTKFLKTASDAHVVSLGLLAAGLSTHTNQIAVHTGQISGHTTTLSEHADSIAALEAVDVTQNADIAELQETVTGLTAIPVYQSGNMVIDSGGQGYVTIADSRVVDSTSLKGFIFMIDIGSGVLYPPNMPAATNCDYTANPDFGGGAYKRLRMDNCGFSLVSHTWPYRLIIFV